jgi:hypothetical protein
LGLPLAGVCDLELELELADGEICFLDNGAEPKPVGSGVAPVMAEVTGKLPGGGAGISCVSIAGTKLSDDGVIEDLPLLVGVLALAGETDEDGEGFLPAGGLSGGGD